MQKPRIRVLVVDDFDPFRQFVCSTLGRRQELQVIGEAADGLQAVQKASELQPELIVLDIGLPNLNGIAAARQIRKLSPQSRIIFLSQESSADVVQEAFDLGASGYVVKTHAGTSLLAAVDAVLVGGRYVSPGVSGHQYTDATEIQALTSTATTLSHRWCRANPTPLATTTLRSIPMMPLLWLVLPILLQPLSMPESRWSWSRPGPIAPVFLRDCSNKAWTFLQPTGRDDISPWMSSTSCQPLW